MARKVAENAPHPTRGVFNFIPALVEPSFSGREWSEYSDQSLLLMDTDRITPPRLLLRRSISQLPQSSVQPIG